MPGCWLAPGKASVITHPPPKQHLRVARICPGIFSASRTPHFPRGTISQAAPARRLFAVVNLRSLCFVLLPRYPRARLSPTSATESSPSPCSMLSSSTCSHTTTVSCSGCCSAKLGVLSSFQLGLPASSSTSFQHFCELFFSKPSLYIFPSRLGPWAHPVWFIAAAEQSLS